MERPFNFSAGPATLPEAVLEQAAAEMLNWRGRGVSVMEMSHRSEEVVGIISQAENDLRELLAVPQTYRILFIQASPTALNAVIPMNLLGKSRHLPTIDGIYTGVWSGRSLEEAKKYAAINIAASGEAAHFNQIPSPDIWRMTDDAAYVHICSNETINGTEFFFTPDTGTVPLVADMSSHILSRPFDVARYGLIFAGAQKIMGMAGVSVVIVRDDLTGYALPICPAAYDFGNLAAYHSCFNTPPVYAIYLCGLVLQWVKRQGGLTAMEAAAIKKSGLLYDCIDASGLYVNPVDRTCRSRMNVPFFLRDEALNATFLAGAEQNGLLQLKGHRSMGGMRASIYNAMPLAGVEKLVAYMREFERTH
ncbi:MAG: 3-phosphoserine/phosphohydroxythreonine transaminase [Burkholderiaceae bacterium]|jgi:phosphoserine aminotransferase|nr:3-phosphoserine/phosphohydroxythreonine transaminase [Burkholderiaceae bacterium]